MPFTPYFQDDFESYSNGQSLNGGSPFTSAGRTIASTEQSYAGAKSAKMSIRSTDMNPGNTGGGFGQWGGVISLSPNITKGGELWVRGRFYFPSSFQWTANAFMKFIRIHNKTSTGANGGYNDLYEEHYPTGKMRFIKELHAVWYTYDGPDFPSNSWENWEIYIKADNVPASSGGDGRVRVWRNTTLIMDLNSVPTLSDSGGSLDAVYILTFWNSANGSPIPDNDCYCDELVIGTNASPPENTDSGGNTFIGNFGATGGGGGGGPPADEDPPVLSAVGPLNSSIPRGAASFNLASQTDEVATCRYGPPGSTSWDAMTDMTTDDGISHAKLLAIRHGVVSPGYAVISRDVSGNESAPVESGNIVAPSKPKSRVLF